MENIELVRIDDRMLHGQVVSTWLKDYGIEQVLIINDKAANDPIQKSVAGLAAPKEVKVHLPPPRSEEKAKLLFLLFLIISSFNISLL